MRDLPIGSTGLARGWLVLSSGLAAIATAASTVSACLTPGAPDCSCLDAASMIAMNRGAVATVAAAHAAEASFASAQSLPSAAASVHVFNFDFSLNPQGSPIMDAAINLGDTVTWNWDGGFHSVTSVSGSQETFNSGDHTPAFTFSHTFTHVGTFAYYCDIHGSDAGNGVATGMAGFVTVSAVPEPVVLTAAIGLPLAFRRRRIR